MSIIPGLVLFLLCVAFIFWPDKDTHAEIAKTRFDYLVERRDVVYDNLRDLNFEYLAGKYPEQDYAEQQGLLEDEAARVLAEMDRLR